MFFFCFFFHIYYDAYRMRKGYIILHFKYICLICFIFIFVLYCLNNIYDLYFIWRHIKYVTGPPNNFFLENALKKNNEFFLIFFLFESTIFRVNNGK